MIWWLSHDVCVSPPAPPDPGFSFESVLFYGNELALLQLDILVFAVVDLIAQNYVLAAIITYIVSWVGGDRAVY